MVAFFDDARNFFNKSKGNYIELCTMLQNSVQSWEHLLSTAGGNLNPEKFAVYIVRSKVKEDDILIMDNVSHYNIPVTSSLDDTTSNVKYLHPDESMIYLGYTSQPDGDQTDDFNLLFRTAKSFARRLLSSAMTRGQVTMTNNRIINPTIKYPLATTLFTDEIIDSLLKVIHPTVISGMGYSLR